MVGSRDSISECNVVLNTIAAEVFRMHVTVLKQQKILTSQYMT